MFNKLQNFFFFKRITKLKLSRKNIHIIWKNKHFYIFFKKRYWRNRKPFFKLARFIKRARAPLITKYRLTKKIFNKIIKDFFKTSQKLNSWTSMTIIKQPQKKPKPLETVLKTKLNRLHHRRRRTFFFLRRTNYRLRRKKYKKAFLGTTINLFNCPYTLKTINIVKKQNYTFW